ncbi:hypothetical protein TSHO111613_10045 [Tsukamurella hominis]
MHRIDDSRILSGSDTVSEPDRIRSPVAAWTWTSARACRAAAPALRAYCQLGNQSSRRHHHMGIGVAVRIGHSQAKFSTTIVA